MIEQEIEVSKSSGLDSTTLVRIVLVALGIASATLLAHSAFGIRFNQDFVRFLDIVRDIVGFIVTPFELVIITPVERWLHSHGFTFDLYPHWKNAFVLLWLLNASETRASGESSDLLGRAGVGWAINAACRWASAALTALIGGVLAGTVPLNNPAVLWWPVVGYLLSGSAAAFINAYSLKLGWAVMRGWVNLVAAALVASVALGWIEPPAVDGQPPQFWWPAVAVFGALTILEMARLAAGLPRSPSSTIGITLTALTVSLAIGALPGPDWLNFNSSPSPGLANLTAFVLIIAVWNLFRAARSAYAHDGNFSVQFFATHYGRIAADILTVLGGAATITYLAHLMS